MSNILSIETKKVTDLDAVTSVAGTDVIPVHNGTGLKKITYDNFRSTVQKSVAPILANNAGAHNSFYRGDSLGDATAVTEDQWAAIKNGSFSDLYIGDYWTSTLSVGSVEKTVYWRIAAFNYFTRYANDTPHVVIVPDTIYVTGAMDSDDDGKSITTNGYGNSKMRSSGMEEAKVIINNVFGEEHIMPYRTNLTTASANGRASASDWYSNCKVELMNEQMVYGSSIFQPTSDGTTVPVNRRIETTQLPLFRYNPALIYGGGDEWWLRDIVSSTDFASVFYSMAYHDAANKVLGVRPYFCLYGG